MRRSLLCLVVLVGGCLPAPPGDSPATADPSGNPGGPAGWQPGWLEIHHIDAGQGVATLIVSPIGRSMLIDAGEANWDGDDGARRVGAYLRKVLGSRHLDYVLISHFHVDHAGFPGYGGIWHLVHRQGFGVDKLLHRDLDSYMGGSAATVRAWRDYLHGPAAASVAPEIVKPGTSQVQLGGGTVVAFVSVDADGRLPAGDLSSDAAPPDENDYSVAALLRFGQLDYFTAGDLSGQTLVSTQGGYSYHDSETAVARLVKDVDVYRVSHHGSSHASNDTLLAQLAPKVAIVQVGDGNQDYHPARGTMARLLASASVYLTEHGAYEGEPPGGKVVGDVVLRSSDGLAFTVAGDAFAASDPARVDADGDGYFVGADPDDRDARVVPASNGICDATYATCGP